VAGGLSFPEAAALLRTLAESGRRIVGFDLNEVAPDPEGRSQWDGNVGARLLYKQIGFTLVSQKN
jgi:agmatinase